MTTHTENHLKHLLKEHQTLDNQIDTMEKTGIFNDLKLEDLKKQRLLLKDEIAIIQVKLKQH
jgi:uncharacterized protein YdcH (DUF465 family)